MAAAHVSNLPGELLTAQHLQQLLHCNSCFHTPQACVTVQDQSRGCCGHLHSFALVHSSGLCDFAGPKTRCCACVRPAERRARRMRPMQADSDSRACAGQKWWQRCTCPTSWEKC